MSGSLIPVFVWCIGKTGIYRIARLLPAVCAFISAIIPAQIQYSAPLEPSSARNAAGENRERTVDSRESVHFVCELLDTGHRIGYNT